MELGLCGPGRPEEESILVRTLAAFQHHVGSKYADLSVFECFEAGERSSVVRLYFCAQ